MRLGINGRFLLAEPTGVQRFAMEVTRRLAARPDVTVFLPMGAAWPHDLPAPARTCHGRLAGRAWEQLELPHQARGERMSALLHPANASPVLGGPHVVVLHDVIPLTRPADFTLAYRMWMSWTHVRAARRAAAVVTVSDWSAGEIARTCGIPRGKLWVVEQGPGPFDSPATSAEVAGVRARHRLPERYVLAVGGEDPRKGAAFLEKIWAAWPDARARPELVVVGRRVEAVHRRTRGREGTGVRRLGRVSDADLRALYTGAVALLHPSEAEGFGRPPLEALACGTRVIAAPYGPARAVLGTAADLIERDPVRWRDAVEALLVESHAARTRRIADGRAWAARFDWERAVDRLWSVCMAASVDA
jgi:glycosyltransferase involved in cell wall biosynthesis